MDRKNDQSQIDTQVLVLAAPASDAVNIQLVLHAADSGVGREQGAQRPDNEDTLSCRIPKCSRCLGAKLQRSYCLFHLLLSTCGLLHTRTVPLGWCRYRLQTEIYLAANHRCSFLLMKKIANGSSGAVSCCCYLPPWEESGWCQSSRPYNAGIQDEGTKRGRDMLVRHPGMGFDAGRSACCSVVFSKEVPQEDLGGGR
jgi:hypothetical protein